MTPLPVASEYRGAISIALSLQVVTTLILLTILDGGTLAQIGGCAMAGFWIGVAIVIARRPRAPRALDLAYIRWGYLAMLAIAVIMSPFIAALR